MVSATLEDTLAQALLPVLQKIQGRQFGLKETRVGEKHDSGGSPITTGYTHGPGGLLSLPGVDQQVFHTIVGAQGILGQLPTKASVFASPTFTVLTGVQNQSGTNKNAVCDNAPTSGLIKSCNLHSVFGRYELATNELELNRLGVLNDRADPMDLRLVGSPIHESGIFTGGPGNPAEPGDLFTNEVARKFWELGIAFYRLLNLQLWRGSPVNNSAGGGYKEVTGFRTLINTGHVDVLTNTACPSVDSDIKNANYLRMDATGAASQIINAMSYMYRTRKNLAERTGVTPVRWVWVMREEMFWELTSYWPCAYLTYRCQLQGNERLNIEGTEMVKMRDEMRSGKYLMLDGERIEVVLDDGIPETTNTQSASVPSGCMASDIFLIPMSVIGGQAVTFLEYMDYGNASIQQALGDNLILARAEGAFLTWPRQTNQCIVWQSKIEPRLVIRTPWLAGRLQNVVICPLQHTRNPFPTDNYFVDGGVTSRPGPSYYHGLW